MLLANRLVIPVACKQWGGVHHMTDYVTMNINEATNLQCKNMLI